MSHIYNLVKDPSGGQVMLMVTHYLDYNGSFLCVPIVTKGFEVKIHYSAIKFLHGIDLNWEVGKVCVPDEMVLDIQTYILNNESLFKNKIKNFKEVMSENREGFPSC